MLYGLIGRKLGHSFSARFFNDKFKDECIPARYELFEIPSVNLMPEIILSHPELYGFNVTIPYKEEILQYLNTLSESARKIGAVNTVRVFRPKTPLLPGFPRMMLEGHNTDAPGFRDALIPLLPRKYVDVVKEALVLGTGGVSKAVVYALEELGIRPTLVSRKAGPGRITYSDVNRDVLSRHQLIVNCTPLGMWPDIESCPPIPYEFIDSSHICFDLVYNPEVTEFMRRAQAGGARVSNGLRMLVNQANLAWEFWQRPYRRKFLSRNVELHHGDGTIECLSLSVVEIQYRPDGSIMDVLVSPFNEEIPGVEYVDTPIILNLP